MTKGMVITPKSVLEIKALAAVSLSPLNFSAYATAVDAGVMAMAMTGAE